MRILSLLAAMLFISAASADEYPSRSIRMVVPFTAGGATDLTARVLAQNLSEQFGQQVIVENKTGANTVLATEYVAHAPADGYTILFHSIGLAANETLVADLPYRLKEDLKPVALVAINPLVLVVNKNMPVKTLPEFIAFLKKNPNVPYGSSGSGTAMHLAGALFQMESGVELMHVPYRGESAAMNDLLGGRISFVFGSFATTETYFASGVLTPIAYLGTQRSPRAPDLPTAIESGTPSYTAYTWNAVLLPKGVPEPIVSKLSAAVNKAMAAPTTDARLREFGFWPITNSTPESAAAYIDEEVKKWREVITKAAIKVD